METETPAVRPKSAKPLLPETEIYLHLLLLLYLLDKKQYKQVSVPILIRKFEEICIWSI